MQSTIVRLALALVLWTSLPAHAAQDEERWQRLLKIQQAAPAPPLREADGVTAEDIEIPSALLGKTMRARVLLPAGYRKGHRYYPAAYFLHGFLNPYTEWDRQTGLARQLEHHPIVVVLPQFDNSFYVDDASDPKGKYYTYFFRELLPAIESRFRVRTEPPARAVVGASMGGYGAMLLALSRPQAFSFAGSFAGSLNLAQDTALPGFLKPYDLDAVLGAADSESRNNADLFKLLEKADAKLVPPLWLSVGSDDYLFDQSLTFFQAAHKKGLPARFVTGPGAHEWAVWDRELPGLFEAMDRALEVR